MRRTNPIHHDPASRARRQHWCVQDSIALLDFLKRKLAPQSATSIKNLLHHRNILVNDAPITQFNYALTPGDDVTVISAHQARYDLDHPKLRILFQDDYLLVVHKDSGLHSVDTTRGGVENAAAILEAYLRRKSPNKRIYVVHRLDRDTSGVMIFAKTREAQQKLIADWNDRILNRTYIAIAEGRIEPPQGTIDCNLYEDDRKVVHATTNPNVGLRAITHYKVLDVDGDNSRVQLDLETGRTNQIRVHLQSIGHPVTGDAKYGAQRDPYGRLALHAKNIRFYHPISQRILSFEVEPPF